MKHLILFENFEHQDNQEVIEKLDTLAGHFGFIQTEPSEDDFVWQQESGDGINIIAKWENQKFDSVVLYELEGQLCINFACEDTGMSGNDSVEDWLEEHMWSYTFPDEDNLIESLITEKNVPTNSELWNQCKSWAKSKYDVWPSAYACGAAAKRYKSKGGKWKKKKKK